MEDGTQKRSELMDTLYGQSADAVYQRMLSLDPKLTEFIQVFAYDQVWRLPPLGLREKSLITVTALAALGKPEQLHWHMSAFLNCGGTVPELRAVIIHLALYCGFPAALAAFAVLEQVLTEQDSDD